MLNNADLGLKRKLSPNLSLARLNLWKDASGLRVPAILRFYVNTILIKIVFSGSLIGPIKLHKYIYAGLQLKYIVT